jgi:hypothetical protein
LNSPNLTLKNVFWCENADLETSIRTSISTIHYIIKLLKKRETARSTDVPAMIISKAHINKKLIIMMVGAALLMFACGTPSQVLNQEALVQTKVAETVMQLNVQTYIAQTQAAWTPTNTLVPTPMPTGIITSIPLPTAEPNSYNSYYDKTLQMECIFWEEVNPGMEGQYQCVYGRVANVILQNNGMYFYFKEDGSGFYFILLKQGYNYFDFPNVQIGNCVQAKGTIKSYMGIPRIETEGTIIYWHSDLYGCG